MRGATARVGEVVVVGVFGDEAADADLAEVVELSAEVLYGGVEVVGVLVEEGEEQFFAAFPVAPLSGPGGLSRSAHRSRGSHAAFTATSTPVSACRQPARPVQPGLPRRLNPRPMTPFAEPLTMVVSTRAGTCQPFGLADPAPVAVRGRGRC